MRPESPSPMLRLLFWESTIRCNLCCAHCRRVEDDSMADTDLTTAQASDLIEQLAQLGQEQPIPPILVFSGGEPLCRPDLFELIPRARQRGLIVALATNGTLIDDTVARRIAEHGVERVSISLDGATAQTHDRLRQLDGSFEQALAGIACLRRAGVPFQVNMTLTRHNRHELTALYELALEIGAVAVHPFMLVPVGCGVELAETDMLTPDQYEEALREMTALERRGQLEIKVTCGPHYERVKREQAKAAGGDGRGDDPGMSRPRHGSGSRGCLAGIGVLFVGHQGDVFPCGYLPVHCGNVTRQPLAEIWRGNMDLARLGDSGQLQGKCGRCGYRKVCGGCRARAYAETRNYLAEEPFCVYQPPR